MDYCGFWSLGPCDIRVGGHTVQDEAVIWQSNRGPVRCGEREHDAKQGCKGRESKDRGGPSMRLMEMQVADVQLSRGRHSRASQGSRFSTGEGMQGLRLMRSSAYVGPWVVCGVDGEEIQNID